MADDCRRAKEEIESEFDRMVRSAGFVDFSTNVR